MNNVFAINELNIKINEVINFNINDEKIVISLFICEIINITTCVNELNNIILSKIFNVINLMIVAYFIILFNFFYLTKREHNNEITIFNINYVTIFFRNFINY